MDKEKLIRNFSLRRDQLTTIQDLLDFRELLLADLGNILDLKGHSANQWLKAHEIRKLLRISAGKLQYLRDNGTIPYKKLGGITYYNIKEIEALMASGKL